MTPTESHRVGMTVAPILDEFEAFVTKLGDRDRVNVERHVAFCETEPTDAHEKLWKRITCILARLAPHAVHTTGQRALRFFVSDGKYRLQLFALEDMRDGNLAIYVGDALQAAIDAGAITRLVSTNEGVRLYEIPDDPGATLKIELLSAANTSSAPDYYKHMLGWNRKALKITLAVDCGDASIRAVETLCIHSARKIDN